MLLSLELAKEVESCRRVGLNHFKRSGIGPNSIAVDGCRFSGNILFGRIVFTKLKNEYVNYLKHSEE